LMKARSRYGGQLPSLGVTVRLEPFGRSHGFAFQLIEKVRHYYSLRNTWCFD
jgi:hypothetical protein